MPPCSCTPHTMMSGPSSNLEMIGVFSSSWRIFCFSSCFFRLASKSPLVPPVVFASTATEFTRYPVPGLLMTLSVVVLARRPNACRCGP